MHFSSDFYRKKKKEDSCLIVGSVQQNRYFLLSLDSWFSHGYSLMLQRGWQIESFCPSSSFEQKEMPRWPLQRVHHTQSTSNYIYMYIYIPFEKLRMIIIIWGIEVVFFYWRDKTKWDGNTAEAVLVHEFLTLFSAQSNAADSIKILHQMILCSKYKNNILIYVLFIF